MIRSILFSLVLLLTFPLSLWGQSTTVSATVVDSSSQAWSGGTYTISFRPVPNQPGPYLWNGSPLTTTQFTGTMNGSGVFSVSIPSSSSITPSGSQWTFTICPSAASPCGAVSLPISGSSEDISTQITAVLPPVHTFPTPMGYAYADSQVQQLPGLGQSYFNTTQKVPKYWDGSAWQTYGSGNGTIQPTPQFRLFIQPNSGTQSIAGPASTSQNAVTPILQGVANTDIFGGIANTISSSFCASGCFFARPQTSSDTATIPNLFTLALTNIHAQDLSNAGAADYYWNNTAPVSSGNDFRYARNTFCGWDTAITSTLGARYCYYTNFIYAPPGGQYVRGEPTGSKTHSDTTWVYSRGINQDHGFIDNYFSIGDKDAYRGYLNHRTGSIAGSDESIEGFGLDINSQPPPSGTVTTGGAGATVVKINFTSNAGNQADGLELIDEADVMDSGNYVGTLTTGVGNAPSTFQSVDINGNPVAHTASSGIATLTSACGSTTIRNQQQSNVCSVTINSGSFTSGGTNFVCVADWHYYEQAAITATGTGTLTLNLAYSHPSGTEIFQGPGCGGRLVLGNGSTPLTTAQVTSYAIAGAPDTTHYAVIVKNLGGQNGNFTVPLSQLNPIMAAGPLVLGPPQRTSNVVTVPINGALGAVDFNGYTAPGSSQIYISGVTPSDFNGAITGVTYNPQTQSLSWPQTGSNETASTNATISLRGANNYSIYCGAETIGIPNVLASSLQTPVLDGTLDLEPNGCTWASGDAVIQPNAYNEHLANDERGVSSDSSDLFPIDSPNSSREYLAMHGAEMSGFVFDNFAGGAGDSVSSFLGHGGLLTPYTYAVLDGGVFNTFVHMLYAPEQSLFTLGCPAGGCSSTSQVVNLFNVGGNSGNGVFGFDTHNSTWQFLNPVNAPSNTSSITAGGGVGIEGNWSGLPLNTFLLTETLGHNYASWGGGTYGDSTAPIGAGTFAAGTIQAGATIPQPLLYSVAGTTGSTSYAYFCTAVSPSGGETLQNATVTITVGNATLNGTNYNHLVCLGNVGDQSVNYYRSTNGGGLGTGLICSHVPLDRNNEFCNDTGQTAGAAAPATDTSGVFKLSGSQNITGVQGTTGTKLLSCAGTFTSGHLVSVDANGNCIDGGAPPTVIANVQITLPTGTLTANTCSSVVTTTMTGVTTTSTFTSAFASDASGVTGYGSSGGLSIVMWPTANTNNLKLCNPTASSITPGAMQLNVGAK